MSYEVKMNVPMPKINRRRRRGVLRTALEGMPVNGMVEVKGKSKQALAAVIYSASKATGYKFVQRAIDDTTAGIWRIS